MDDYYGVDVVLPLSYILKRASQPQLDFHRPPYCPADTRGHVRYWSAETGRNQPQGHRSSPPPPHNPTNPPPSPLEAIRHLLFPDWRRTVHSRPRPTPHGPRPLCTWLSTHMLRQGRGGWRDVGGVSYLQVLPPDVDGRKGQLHLLPAGVFMALVCDLDEDEEDPCCDAPGHQHEDPCWRATARG